MFFSASHARADFYIYTDSTGVMHVTDRPDSREYRWFMAERGKSRALSVHPYDEIIREASARHGVDPVLVRAIVKVESDFNPRAVSEAGATGLMQLMPETARLMGVKDVYDPRENIEGGVRYLGYLMRAFGGEMKLVIAAYNAGETAVRKYRRIPPYEETRRYVEKVQSYQKLFSKTVR